MKRMHAALKLDFLLLWRQGFFWAALFLIVLWVGILFFFSPAARTWLVPYAIFFDLSVFGFYFVAAQVFLEKGERTLSALAVTPLRPTEYLLSKLVSNALSALGMSLVLAIVYFWAAFHAGWLTLGVISNSWLMIILGLSIAGRYQTISDFLMPSMIFAMPSQLPLLDYFGIWNHWLIYLVPTQPSMILIEAAFRPVEPWELLYAAGYLALLLPLSLWWGNRVLAGILRRAG
jgi:fluoroquinolone transport system permease protein